MKLLAMLTVFASFGASAQIFDVIKNEIVNSYAGSFRLKHGENFLRCERSIPGSWHSPHSGRLVLKLDHISENALNLGFLGVGLSSSHAEMISSNQCYHFSDRIAQAYGQKVTVRVEVSKVTIWNRRAKICSQVFKEKVFARPIGFSQDFMASKTLALGPVDQSRCEK